MLTGSSDHGGKFCGMARMKGAYDPDAARPFHDPDKTHNLQGIIPIEWVIIKDVPFRRFQDLRCNEQIVTTLRHGNTIPGEAGRRTVKRYVEEPHGRTAILRTFLGMPEHSPSSSARFLQNRWSNRPAGHPGARCSITHDEWRPPKGPRRGSRDLSPIVRGDYYSVDSRNVGYRGFARPTGYEPPRGAHTRTRGHQGIHQ